MRLTFFFGFYLWLFQVQALSTLSEDVSRLLKTSGLRAEIVTAQSDQSSFSYRCVGAKLVLNILGPKTEQVSTAYKALREMGFLFPHPRWTITPQKKDICKHAKKGTWSPRQKVRGLHLHTLHPNEWVTSFFMEGHEVINQELILWMARNQLNFLQVQLLRRPVSEFKDRYLATQSFAANFGVQVGVSLSLSMIQQRIFQLIPPWKSFLGLDTLQDLEANLQLLTKELNPSFVTLELGKTEFHSTPPQKTIQWMNAAAKILKEEKRDLFIKVHASSNQVSSEFGNFNFLPQYADPHVGILPHTVFFYGIQDEFTPMYGRKDFQDMKDFMLKENSKRKTLYYPETSYWVGMDADIPLLLTDYLKARFEDTILLEKNQILGQVNFTSTQEMGYWLKDWSYALFFDSDCKSPLCGLGLIGEDLLQWQKMMEYQFQFFKQRQVIQYLSSSNLMDELFPVFEKVHERVLLRDYFRKPELLRKSIQDLESALSAWPKIKVKNQELSALQEVTHLRLRHALEIRKSLAGESAGLGAAEGLRKQAQSLIHSQVVLRYPELPLHTTWKENPSSYGYGVIQPAWELHFWKREEGIVAARRLNPFYKNIYDPLRILF
jgi:hypothetical protein